MSERRGENVALGQACNWSIALWVSGGLTVALTLLWLPLLAVGTAITVYIANRQFAAMERLIDGDDDR